VGRNAGVRGASFLSDMRPHLLASFVYMHNLIFGGFPGAVNGVAWSLEVEVQFYVLVPLLTVLFTIRDPRIRRSVVLLIMLVAGLLSNPLYGSLHFHYSIAYYLTFFLAGFMVCDLYLTRQIWQKSFAWDVFALALWPLVWYLGKYTGHVVLPFVIVVLYLAAFRGKIWSAIFSNPAITNIGGMCYSIYLFHFIIIYGVKHLTAPLHIGQNFWAYYLLQCALIIPVVLLLCGAFFVLIERPCMDPTWPRKLWNKSRSLLSNTERLQAPATKGDA
jgi:peptidoglycan/LPS O-acetylase OafA/YrhL